MQNELVIKEDIKNKIYHIRGKDVMFDSDLAKLYRCKNGTKTINQAVSRHLDRFPEDFYFQLTKEEYEKFDLRSQSGTTRNKSRSLPYVFTEQGVAMLATVLRTEVATQMSILIMRAFVLMRHYLNNNDNRISNLESKVIDIDKDVKLLQESFNCFKEKESAIFFEGEIFDAYQKILEILKKGKKEIIIIDNYADYNTLNLIKKIKTKVIIITNSNYITDIDLEKYNKEYNNLKLIKNNLFHDRYIIIDKKDVYLLGSSINNIGSKISTIMLLNDSYICDNLLNKIYDILITY